MARVAAGMHWRTCGENVVCSGTFAMHAPFRRCLTACHTPFDRAHRTRRAIWASSLAFGKSSPTQSWRASIHLRAMTQSNGEQRDASANEATHRPLNDTFDSLPTTIFEVMTRLSLQHNSINLGQGVGIAVQLQIAEPFEGGVFDSECLA